MLIVGSYKLTGEKVRQKFWLDKLDYFDSLYIEGVLEKLTIERTKQWEERTHVQGKREWSTANENYSESFFCYII